MLETDNSNFYRMKRGQSAADVEAVFCAPVRGEAFAGKIIALPRVRLAVYTAEVGDTYRKIAEKFSLDTAELTTLNGGLPVYPTARIYVPCANPRADA